MAPLRRCAGGEARWCRRISPTSLLLLLLPTTAAFSLPYSPLPSSRSAMPHAHARLRTLPTAAWGRRSRVGAVGAVAMRGAKTDVKQDGEGGIQSYYEVLGVGMGDAPEDVKRAYQSLARVYHPDVTGGDEDSTEVFIIVNEAYEVLSDETRRKRYNSDLLLQGYRPPAAAYTGKPRGQELGMSTLEFFAVVVLVNIPGFLFLWAPLFGIKVDMDLIYGLIGAK